MPSPLPYFPFYINDWVTSLTVQAMSPAERGLYLECMILQWREGFVPEDPAVLARATGWNIRTIRSLWPVVSAALHRDDDGFIRSSRLSEERVRAALKSVSASESAKRRYERSARASVSVSESSSSLPESRARLPLDAPVTGTQKTPSSGFDAFWERYKKLRDAGRQNLAAQIWISLDCDDHQAAVMRCLASYELSRDAHNGAVQNADQWLRTVHDAKYAVTWPAAPKSGQETQREKILAMNYKR